MAAGDADAAEDFDAAGAADTVEDVDVAVAAVAMVFENMGLNAVGIAAGAEAEQE